MTLLVVFVYVQMFSCVPGRVHSGFRHVCTINHYNATAFFYTRRGPAENLDLPKGVRSTTFSGRVLDSKSPPKGKTRHLEITAKPSPNTYSGIPLTVVLDPTAVYTELKTL